MLVFFDFNSDQIQTLEAQRLFQWLEDDRNRIAQQYILVASADNTGSVTFNDQLKIRRAKAVKDFMVAHGIAENKIVIRTETEIQESTKPDFLYRRVNIVLQ